MSEYFMNVSFGLLLFLSINAFVKNYKRSVIISVMLSVISFQISLFDRLGFEVFWNYVAIMYSGLLAFLGAMIGCAFKIFADSLHEK